MAVGGDIIEVTFNHPTLGSGTLKPKSSEDSTFNTGGFRSADDASNVAGDGTPINSINRMRWSFEVVISWDMNNANEIEILEQMSGSPDDADWTFTVINGTVWGAKGRPVGDLSGNGNTALISLKASGGGKMKKII